MKVLQNSSHVNAIFVTVLLRYPATNIVIIDVYSHTDMILHSQEPINLSIILISKPDLNFAG